MGSGIPVTYYRQSISPRLELGAKAVSSGGCAWSSSELKGDPLAVDDSSQTFLMSMIKVQKLQKSYGLLTVLFDVSFSLGRGQKAALVGHNGTGKTTLLTILAGLEDQDAGKIDIARDACIGYLPQDTSLSGKESIMNYLRQVSGIEALEKEIENLSAELSDPEKLQRYGEAQSKYEHLDGYRFAHRAEVMLSGFGLVDVGLDRPLCNLSSGQKGKVALAGILLKGVDLLLLDEPTNNLDLPALIWLEDFLQKSEASCIVVSHDRRFLDRVVRKIFELDWRTHALTVTGGTYSDYLEMVAKRIAGQKEEYRLQQEEIERLNEKAREKKADAAQGSHWSPSDNDKFLRGFKRDRASKSSKAAKAIEKNRKELKLQEEKAAKFKDKHRSLFAKRTAVLAESSDASFALAAQKQVEENLRQAESALLSAIELKADYAPAHFELSLIYEEQGRLAEALIKMESVKRYNPLDVGVAFQLGVLYLQQGKNDLAQMEFERAIELVPTFANAHWYLSAVHELKGDLESAVLEVEIVLELDPDNEVVKAKLARLQAGLVATDVPEPIEN